MSDLQNLSKCLLHLAADLVHTSASPPTEDSRDRVWQLVLSVRQLSEALMGEFLDKREADDGTSKIPRQAFQAEVEKLAAKHRTATPPPDDWAVEDHKAGVTEALDNILRSFSKCEARAMTVPIEGHGDGDLLGGTIYPYRSAGQALQFRLQEITHGSVFDYERVEDEQRVWIRQVPVAREVAR